MLLGSPEVTAYDLRFRLLDIPVRVHPLFWLVMLILSGFENDLKSAAVFVACAFVSILVHEMGHGLSSRAVGSEPVGIVLYAMGGFCQSMSRPQTTAQRLFVLLMGPGAGFLFLGVVLAYLNARYGIHPVNAMALLGVGPGNRMEALFALHVAAGSLTRVAVFSLLYINFWWGVFNLFPIWPLDGGQALGVILGVVNPRHGTRWCHIVSFLTAGGIALWEASLHQYMSALWIGYFAFINYQQLQSLHDSYQYSDDGGAWRR